MRLNKRPVVVGAEGKGRRQRLVPIGVADRRDTGHGVTAIVRYLLERADELPDDYLFLARDGYPVTAEGGNDLIHRLGALAGVENAGRYWTFSSPERADWV
jgi:site-specific recombinase XerD